MSSSDAFQIPNILANHVTCQKFCGLFEECLATLAESFPECQSTKNELERYRTEVKNKEPAEVNMIQSWHRDMSTGSGEISSMRQSSGSNNPSEEDGLRSDDSSEEILRSLYDRSDQHDDAAWDVFPLFRGLSIRPKVQDLGSDATLVLWEYLDGMNRHSRIYNAIPSQMLEKIQSTALSYMNKIQSGEMKFDMENLNWDDVKNVGQNLMDTINPQDMAEFTGNITGLAQSLKINNIQDVFKLVGEVPGVSEVMNNNGHLVGLLEQLLQNDSTQEIIQNVDRMMGGGNTNNNNNSSSGGKTGGK